MIPLQNKMGRFLIWILIGVIMKFCIMAYGYSILQPCNTKRKISIPCIIKCIFIVNSPIDIKSFLCSKFNLSNFFIGNQSINKCT